MEGFEQDVASGERFEFGKNWSRFLSVLNEERIQAAVKSLQEKLQVEDLQGKCFLDIGSGSGLFSLAARKLGARVHSFDYDPNSVNCARELRRRFFAEDDEWTIEQGSALDREYLESLGKFDIVYSWGVLHHTGSMYEALKNATIPVSEGGRLFISIYNDQGVRSRIWKKLKKTYCSLPGFLKLPYTLITMMPYQFALFVASCILFRPIQFLKKRLRKADERGMNWWHDVVDWIGGYPFEVAKPQEIIHFYRDRGFVIDRLFSVGDRLGCNEYVLTNLTEAMKAGHSEGIPLKEQLAA
ncbi:MAG: SAM-dependent methyltransferase [Planctomycetaceae bacterium]|nr:SAM-dependent methyltransferase [Planctomycetaceae bacterium]